MSQKCVVCCSEQNVNVKHACLCTANFASFNLMRSSFGVWNLRSSLSTETCVVCQWLETSALSVVLITRKLSIAIPRGICIVIVRDDKQTRRIFPDDDKLCSFCNLRSLLSFFLIKNRDGVTTISFISASPLDDMILFCKTGTFVLFFGC